MDRRNPALPTAQQTGEDAQSFHPAIECAQEEGPVPCSGMSKEEPCSDALQPSLTRLCVTN